MESKYLKPAVSRAGPKNVSSVSSFFAAASSRQGTRLVLSGKSPESNHRRNRPLHLNRKNLVLSLAFSLVALPVWAAHTYSTDWSPSQPINIGTMKVQPGQYELKAEAGKSELQVLQKNKVIATVPIHWTTLTSKPRSSEIQTDGTKVTGVEFGGQTAAIQID
jgi:hypothetical protein